MKLFEVTEWVPSGVSAVWAVWTDVNSWSGWDPHEEAASFEGPFEAGASGWAKPKGAPAGNFSLTEVVVDQRWVSRSELPGGGLTFTHSVREENDGTVVTLLAEVHGPLTPLLKLVWARRMRRDAPHTLRALGAEARRRVDLQR